MCPDIRSTSCFARFMLILACFLFSNCDPEPVSFFLSLLAERCKAMIRNTVIHGLDFLVVLYVIFSCSSPEAYCSSWWQLPGSRSLLAEQAGTCFPLHQVSSVVFQIQFLYYGTRIQFFVEGNWLVGTPFVKFSFQTILFNIQLLWKVPVVGKNIM